MIEREGLRPKFWERPLDTLTRPEWEALCDGCGKCCLHKIEYQNPTEVILTCVACQLFDIETGLCSDYANRHDTVPNCVVLSPDNIAEKAYFMPVTCAYKRLYEGKCLPTWHPLLTGDPESPHRAIASARGWVRSELEVPEEEWEDYLVAEPTGPAHALKD